jgi:hypothetical protein
MIPDFDRMVGYSLFYIYNLGVGCRFGGFADYIINNTTISAKMTTILMMRLIVTSISLRATGKPMRTTFPK